MQKNLIKTSFYFVYVTKLCLVLDTQLPVFIK